MNTIRCRKLVEVNTDSQRRCYYGVHARSEIVWSSWTKLDSGIPEEAVPRRLKFWKELNAYAVLQRGEVGTKMEFEVVKEGTA